MTDEDKKTQNENETRMTAEDEVNECLSFYAHLVLSEHLVLDTDKDVISPEHLGGDMEKAMMLSMGNMMSRQILRNYNIDAYEVVSFLETKLVEAIHTGTYPEGKDDMFLTNIRDIENETQEQRRSRRLMHLTKCAVNVGRMVCGDDFIFDEENGGMGFPADSPAYLKFYMEGVIDRFGDEATVVSSVIDPDDHDARLELLKSEAEKFKSQKHIDPDSEDNNDDPFGMFM